MGETGQCRTPPSKLQFSAQSIRNFLGKAALRKIPEAEFPHVAVEFSVSWVSSGRLPAQTSKRKSKDPGLRAFEMSLRRASYPITGSLVLLRSVGNKRNHQSDRIFTRRKDD